MQSNFNHVRQLLYGLQNSPTHSSRSLLINASFRKAAFTAEKRNHFARFVFQLCLNARMLKPPVANDLCTLIVYGKYSALQRF